MKKQVFYIVMSLLILQILVVSSTACQKAVATQEMQTADDNIKKTRLSFKQERYSDKAFAKEPRLQFVWNQAGEGCDAIWSIKLDGSDLQLAVDYKVLEAIGLKNIHEAPRRSWDNRWIAVAGYSGEQRMLVLVDLKDGTAKKIKEELGTAWPCWSPDSKKLYFSTMEGLQCYDIDTGESKHVEGKGSARLYSFPGKDYFLYLQDFGYGKTDSHFENVQEFKLIDFGTDNMAFSPDSRYLLVPESIESRIYLFDLQNNNEKTTINGQSLTAHIIMTPDDEWIYYGYGNELHRFNWNTREEEIFFRADNGRMAYFSIINYRGTGQGK